MLCQRCHQREANVHIVQIHQHQRVEHHLCEVCAKAIQEGIMATVANNSLNMNDLLGSFIGMPPLESTHYDPGLACPSCGALYAKIAETGRVGCSDCYTTLEEALEPSLKKLHGNNTHQGKIPHRAGASLQTKRKIQELKQALAKAIEKEAYEQAAQLRDEIHAAEQTAKNETVTHNE
jgi:protein arginine kinase activator